MGVRPTDSDAHRGDFRDRNNLRLTRIDAFVKEVFPVCAKLAEALYVKGLMAFL